MKISVLISIYSEPTEWIREALDSVLNQTFQDFEIVLINDNPSRIENDLIVEEYEKKFKLFKYIKNEVNIGLTKSLNKGLKLCEGEYIARMDADDICFSTRFEKQVEFMDANQFVVASGCNIETFGTKKSVKYFSCSINHIRDFFFIANPTNVPIAHPTAFIRNKVLINNKIVYDEKYKKGQDFALWYKLLQVGEISNVQEILLKYRLSDLQISHNSQVEQVLTRKHIYIIHIMRLLNLKNECVFSIDKELYYLLKDNKKEIISITSRNHLDGLLIFLFSNISISKREGLRLLIKEYKIFLNPNIRLKEKIKCLFCLLKK